MPDLSQNQAPPFGPARSQRPAPILLTYYLLCSLLTGPLFFVPLVPLWFRYLTLRYHFDEDGVSMSWGILFRREVQLTYRRIQDIHLSANIVQRWLGLANVGIQTASGSSTPEMTIEGILDPDRLRDFLYVRMRGARGEPATPAAAAGPAAPPAAPMPPGHDAEVLPLLREIRDALLGAAERLEKR